MKKVNIFLLIIDDQLIKLSFVSFPIETVFCLRDVPLHFKNNIFLNFW